MNDPGVRHEILVWRDRWFLNVDREYAQLRNNLSSKLRAALTALDDNHIVKQLNELLRDLIFPMLDSFEGAKRRSILINARIELHQIYEVATLHRRERFSWPALIYDDQSDQWETHPEFVKLVNPTIFWRLNTYAFANICRKNVIAIVDDLVFNSDATINLSRKARLIGAIDRACNEALREA